MTGIWIRQKIECHPAYQRQPRRGPPPLSYALIHYTGRPLWAPEEYARSLQKPPSERKRRWSVHFLVGGDGHTVQCVPLGKEASHAGDGKLLGKSPNIGSVGFEVINSGYGVRPGDTTITARHRNPDSRGEKQWHVYSQMQYKAVADVLRDICVFRGAPHDALLVLGHEDVTNRWTKGKPGGKLDPGPAWDWDLLIALCMTDAIPVQRMMFDFSQGELVRVPNQMFDAQGSRIWATNDQQV